MAQIIFDYYFLETATSIALDGYLLEDGSGFILIENDPEEDYYRNFVNDVIID